MYTEDKEVKKVCLSAFPGYTGKMFKVENHVPKTYHQYWDGGSKTDYILFDLESGKTQPMPNNSAFDAMANKFDLPPLAQNVVLVTHSIFCGKDRGLTLYCRPDQFNQEALPPAGPVLTWAEKVVLASYSFKNSYAGESNVRFKEAARQSGIGPVEYETAKLALQAKGYMNKAFALTLEGKNVREACDLWSNSFYKLKQEKPVTV